MIEKYWRVDIEHHYEKRTMLDQTTLVREECNLKNTPIAGFAALMLEEVEVRKNVLNANDWKVPKPENMVTPITSSLTRWGSSSKLNREDCIPKETKPKTIHIKDMQGSATMFKSVTTCNKKRENKKK